MLGICSLKMAKIKDREERESLINVESKLCPAGLGNLRLCVCVCCVCVYVCVNEMWRDTQKRLLLFLKPKTNKCRYIINAQYVESLKPLSLHLVVPLLFSTGTMTTSYQIFLPTWNTQISSTFLFFNYKCSFPVIFF
jgi:hypothetical protein